MQTVSAQNPEGEKPFIRPRRSWEDYVKINNREMGYKSEECIRLAQLQGPVAGSC